MATEENPPSPDPDEANETVEAILVSAAETDNHFAQTEAPVLATLEAPVLATLVDPEAPVVEVQNVIPALPIENLAATGGALGAVVLGVWSIAGAFMSGWSVINAVMGLTMGYWGLSSSHPRWAWIGILCCLLGIALCVYRTS